MALFYALIRVLRNRAYARTIRERLGLLPAAFEGEGGQSIWIHAVSVGEVLSSAALIRELRARFAAPIFLSTTTLAGYRTAGDRLAGSAFRFYAPIDTVGAVRRVLKVLKPSVVVVLETEIWPNLFREAKRAGCGLIIANARISDRAFPKYAKRRWFFKGVLCWPDRILAQSQEVASRYIALGAIPHRVAVTPNLKYDFVPREPAPDSPVCKWVTVTRGPLLIAASTTADDQTNEDAAVIDAFRKLDGWRLILAPRKPERFDAVAALLRNARIPFWRRTQQTFGDERVLLLDTVGELPSLFGLADVVFMGGTLTDTGGHNFLEPAFAGKPIVVGPRLENFREIAEEFRRAGALLEVRNAPELPDAFQRALNDGAIGPRALSLAGAKRGAAAQVADEVQQLYEQSEFCEPIGWAKRAILGPAAALWNFGARRRARAELAGRGALDAPVISIGNITAGGTGKTPFVLHLARRFREQGLEPVVLTRGHGRISPHRELILPRGSQTDVWHTGDEPQLVLRSGLAGLGIGRDRYVAGRRAERELKPDVFLLDDGFSHQRLARDVDIVLIDSLDPFGGCAPIPLGRLREPLSELRRADLFVLTRCEPHRNYRAIERRLQELNPNASIFRSRMVPREWISYETGSPKEPPRRVIAICGLGNPDSFWRTLKEVRIEPLDRISYGDHHAYAPLELQALKRYAESRRAEGIVTTEKDVVNFTWDAIEALRGLPVYWLRVDVEIDDEEEFLGQVNPAGIRARRASDRPLAPVHP